MEAAADHPHLNLVERTTRAASRTTAVDATASTSCPSTRSQRRAAPARRPTTSSTTSSRSTAVPRSTWLRSFTSRSPMSARGCSTSRRRSTSSTRTNTLLRWPSTAAASRCSPTCGRPQSRKTKNGHRKAAEGVATTGSSEALMLGGLAMKKRWQNKRKAEGKSFKEPGPNLVFGANCQVCIEKLCRVVSINTSGHKYGMVLPGLGWVVFRSSDVLPRELVFELHYLGSVEYSFGLNFSRPAAPVLAQYFNFLNLGYEGYRSVMLENLKNARLLSRALELSGYYTVLSDIHRPANKVAQAAKAVGVASELDAENYMPGLPVVSFRWTDEFQKKYRTWTRSLCRRCFAPRAGSCPRTTSARTSSRSTFSASSAVRT
ncbi:hypothetical protein L7F22_048389 [Adiantum nelumboides]|nr:hypothetical protein [Adiantum nelumboides]